MPEFRALLRTCPVVQAELPDGSTAWLAGGYEEVRQTVVDPRFSRALAVAPGRSLQGTDVLAAGSILGMDPPEHTRLRKLIAKAFTVRRVEMMRPRVVAIVNQLIDSLLAGPQPADLAARFSLPLPVQVICEMLGVPEADMEQFHAWSDAALGDWQRDTDQILTAMAEMYGYFAGLTQRRRSNPAGGQTGEVPDERGVEPRVIFVARSPRLSPGTPLSVGEHRRTQAGHAARRIAGPTRRWRDRPAAWRPLCRWPSRR